MSESWQVIVRGFAESSWLDLANLLLGIVGVALMIGRSLWAFPVGLVAVAVQGVLFFKAKFYADATLQVFFFWTLAWGWRHWLVAKKHEAELPVARLSHRQLAVVLGSAALGAVLWAAALQRWTDAVMPWRDAFIASFSIAAQVLQARKALANWALWIVVNLVAISAYWRAELAFTAFLYAIYLVMAVLGWRAWHRAQTRAGGGA